MDYREYKKSAIRHYVTCQYLLDEALKRKSQDKISLLTNIYYLSGYIIETSLSYAYFSHINHNGHVEDSLDYQNGFKTHKFDVKINFILRKNGDLTLLPFIRQKVQNTNLSNLYKHWSTDFRYSINHPIKERDITDGLMNDYLQQLKIIMQIIFQRF